MKRTKEVITHGDGVEWAGALRKLVKLYALTRTDGVDAIGERLKQEATIFRSFKDVDSKSLSADDRREYANAILRLVELAKALTGEDE